VLMGLNVDSTWCKLLNSHHIIVKYTITNFRVVWNGKIPPQDVI
jgi:hypothetical protein